MVASISRVRTVFQEERIIFCTPQVSWFVNRFFLSLQLRNVLNHCRLWSLGLFYMWEIQPLEEAHQVNPVYIVCTNPIVQWVNVLGFAITIKERKQLLSCYFAE